MNLVSIEDFFDSPFKSTFNPGRKKHLGKIPCKGLFLRCSVSDYFNEERAEIIQTTKYRILKKMSCQNADCQICDANGFYADYDMAGNINDMAIVYPKLSINGAIYKVNFLYYSEDEWEWRLEKYDWVSDIH